MLAGLEERAATAPPGPAAAYSRLMPEAARRRLRAVRLIPRMLAAHANRTAVASRRRARLVVPVVWERRNPEVTPGEFDELPSGVSIRIVRVRVLG